MDRFRIGLRQADVVGLAVDDEAQETVFGTQLLQRGGELEFLLVNARRFLVVDRHKLKDIKDSLMLDQMLFQGDFSQQEIHRLFRDPDNASSIARWTPCDLYLIADVYGREKGMEAKIKVLSTPDNEVFGTLETFVEDRQDRESVERRQDDGVQYKLLPRDHRFRLRILCRRATGLAPGQGRSRDRLVQARLYYLRFGWHNYARFLHIHRGDNRYNWRNRPKRRG